jgi:CubicO group peptidase (beta-lactamase class C family)
MPCSMIAIWRGSTLGHYAQFGLQDRERRGPVSQDTIFRIYSMTKPIASIALMRLHEQGLFMLEDPVSRYLPEWKDARVYVTGEHPNFVTRPADRAMTIRDLLTHQAGLTYGFMVRTSVDAAYRKTAGPEAGLKDLEEMSRVLSALPLEFSPGRHWAYSHATDLVGYLAQVISGQRLDLHLKEHIFDPLGMVDTAFAVPRDSVGRFAANYQSVDGTAGLTLMDDPTTSAYAGHVTMHSGGGGLVSTIHDYSRFARMLLNGGSLDGKRIIGRKTLALMASNHLEGGRDMEEAAYGPNIGVVRTGMGFGLGFGVVLDPAKAQLAASRGEFYWSGAASTHFWVDPSEDLTAVFMTQLFSLGRPSTLGRELRAMVYAALD